jgi:dihydroneopterin aldolase
MNRARLFLTGIRAEGRHGARVGEKVEVHEDSIDATADYRGVTDAVREIVEQGSFDLIETMAEAIAHRIASFPRVAEVTAVVHKPKAAGRLGIDGVAAGATASADSSE